MELRESTLPHPSPPEPETLVRREINSEVTSLSQCACAPFPCVRHPLPCVGIPLPCVRPYVQPVADQVKILGEGGMVGYGGRFFRVNPKFVQFKAFQGPEVNDSSSKLRTSNISSQKYNNLSIAHFHIQKGALG